MSDLPPHPFYPKDPPRNRRIVFEMEKAESVKKQMLQDFVHEEQTIFFKTNKDGTAELDLNGDRIPWTLQKELHRRWAKRNQKVDQVYREKMTQIMRVYRKQCDDFITKFPEDAMDMGLRRIPNRAISRRPSGYPMKPNNNYFLFKASVRDAILHEMKTTFVQDTMLSGPDDPTRIIRFYKTDANGNAELDQNGNKITWALQKEIARRWMTLPEAQKFVYTLQAYHGKIAWYIKQNAWIDEHPDEARMHGLTLKNLDDYPMPILHIPPLPLLSQL